ncbi:MAG: GNAT family N-acetyltransferase [Cellvibrionales bacterium]|nr:GNAT family N-acetyltransferase [Cellvibrionales bacterium]
MKIIEVETRRLWLRQWQASDLESFAQLNADPQVMAHFPSMYSKGQSDKMAAAIESIITQQGWGFWALEEKQSGHFIGFTGLNRLDTEMPFSPCVEIGWRLAKAYWGQGFATEAAKAAFRVGFINLNLDEIVAFTALTNRRSQAVMERLHMQREAETFDHPKIPEGQRLRAHCLYRLSQNRWQSLEK